MGPHGCIAKSHKGSLPCFEFSCPKTGTAALPDAFVSDLGWKWRCKWTWDVSIVDDYWWLLMLDVWLCLIRIFYSGLVESEDVRSQVSNENGRLTLLLRLCSLNIEVTHLCLNRLRSTWTSPNLKQQLRKSDRLHSAKALDAHQDPTLLLPPCLLEGPYIWFAGQC